MKLKQKQNVITEERKYRTSLFRERTNWLPKAESQSIPNSFGFTSFNRRL